MFREAAEIFVAKDHSNQAATTWLNLGVLASRANRLQEALAWYEKVREARERDPKTTTTQRGNLHNNIANVYRRQRDFARARAEATLADAGKENIYPEATMLAGAERAVRLAGDVS